MSEPRNARPHSRVLWTLAIAQGVAIAVLSFALASRPASPAASVPPRSAGDVPSNSAAVPGRPEVPELVVPARTGREPKPESLADAAAPTRFAESTPTAEPAPNDGAILYGRFLDESGGIVEDVTPSLRREGETEARSSTGPSEQGRFLYAGLEPGRFEMHASAQGFLAFAETFEMAEGAERLHRDFVLRRARILAVSMLTPDGVPLMRALMERNRVGSFPTPLGQIAAIATRAEPTEDFPPSGRIRQTYGLGTYRFAPGPPELELPADCEGYFHLEEREALWISVVFRHCILAKQRVEARQDLVTFTVQLDAVLEKLASVRIRVIDEQRAPIPGVWFRIEQAGIGDRRTDADGRVEAPHVPPGRHELWLTSPANDRDRFELELAPGAALDLGDFVFAPMHTLKCRVENLQGDRQRFNISALRLDPPPHAALAFGPIVARVDAEGRFELKLADGRYWIRASGAGAASLEIDSRSYRDTPLVVPLAPEAALRIEERPGEELLSLFVFDAQGRRLTRRLLREGAKNPIPCLPGEYDLRLVDRRGEVISSRRVLVPAEGLDLRVPE